MLVGSVNVHVVIETCHECFSSIIFFLQSVSAVRGPRHSSADRRVHGSDPSRYRNSSDEKNKPGKSLTSSSVPSKKKSRTYDCLFKNFIGA